MADTAANKARASIQMRRMKLKHLHPAPYNPRGIDASAYAGLAFSIEHFGNVQPIVWNERTGNIVSGHQRLRVLLERGDTHTDVVVVDLSEADEKALNVTQNNPHIAGHFTAELQPLLVELKDLPGLEPLRLQELAEIGGNSPDIDLGDGEIEETEIQDRITVFVPRRHVQQAKLELKALIDKYGGAVI